MPANAESYERARTMRKALTPPEARLWVALKGRQLGVRFRRQHPIPPYVADFCVVSARLVVELDGSQHCEEIDTARTRFLESQGWHVLRFWNNDGLRQTEAVLDAIWNAINDRTLSPTPLPTGEGLKSA